jgi:hypothetical protein
MKIQILNRVNSMQQKLTVVNIIDTTYSTS